MEVRALLLLAVAMAAPGLAGEEPSGDPSDLVLSVALERTFFELGEPVAYQTAICNPTPETISVLVGGCNCGISRTDVVDASGTVVAFETCDGCGGGIFQQVWLPGQCTTHASKHWPQTLGRFDAGGDLFTGPPAVGGVYRLVVKHEFFSAVFIEGASEAFVLGSAPAVPTLGFESAWTLVLVLAVVALYRFRRGAA